MQVTIPQLTIGIMRCNPRNRLYLKVWRNGGFMLRICNAIIFLTVWPKSLNDPGDDRV